MARFSKHFILFLSVYFFAYLMFSCQNGEDIGELYGQWKLDEATDINGESFVKDGMYLSFQSRVACVKQVNHITHGYQDVFAAFRQEGDSLLFHFSSSSHSVDDTVMVCRTFRFEPFINTRLHIVKSSDRNLILEDHGTCWYFSKY